MSVVWRANKDLLDPLFADDVEEFLADSPYAWYVLSGYRSNEEQKILWEAYQKGGPRAAPPGRSAHNHKLAVDVVLDADAAMPGLQPSWNTKLPAWLWLKAASIPHPRIRGGWRFGDWPHLQSTLWKDGRYPTEEVA